MRNIVFFIFQLLILIAIYTGSNFIVRQTSLPVPGNVLGMILLFLCLTTGIVKLKYIEKAAEFLIKHLSLFFIPYAVGLMTYGKLIQTSGWELLLMIAGSTVIGLVVTSGITQYLSSKETQKHGRSNSI
ncbi:CidA/LrgA family protein [Metabacillus halosaccharovorans]|uniref:CidA/LrgA family protein n=1 Tax=Metabacillus halosaccharovorans TaxID=930124 RepID=UPI0020A7F0B0|nr:CidA/LrgA family protein [Metabacillus halosaccharovorans]